MPQKNEETIFKEIEQFKKDQRRGNLVMKILGIQLILFFSIALYLVLSKDLGKVFFPTSLNVIGFILFILGLIFTFIHLNRVKREIRKGIEPPKEDKIEYLSHWEAYYKNTLKAMENPFWYFFPPAPGVVLMMVGDTLNEALGLQSIGIFILNLLLVVVATVGTYYLLRSQAIKTLHAKIDDANGLISELRARG